MNLYRKFFTVLLLCLMVTGLTSAAFYQLSFRGLEIDNTDVDAGETIDLSTNIVNLGDNPRTDIRVEAMLVRESDKSVVYREDLKTDVDLAGREAILVDGSFEVPENIPGANYTLTVRAVDASGIAKAFVSEKVTVNNDRSLTSVNFGNKGVFLLAERVVTGDGFTKTYDLPSYGDQGENVLPGSNFTLRFNLENTGTERVSPEARFEIVPTYSDDAEPIKEFTRELGPISPQATREYSFDSEVKTPGTYEINVDVVDSGENFLSSSQVRLVIAGSGGSITDVANTQDTYVAGESVMATATVVGPADGSTVVRDAFLRMNISKDGQQVASTSKTIDRLPLSPQGYKLQTDVNQELSNYTLEISLGKDDQIYDTYVASYQPLTAERSLTDGGQIKMQNACFDDGVCTEREFEIGNCYDCNGVSKSKFVNNEGDDKDSNQDSGNTLIYVALVLLLVAILGGLGYKYRRWNE